MTDRHEKPSRKTSLKRIVAVAAVAGASLVGAGCSDRDARPSNVPASAEAKQPSNAEIVAEINDNVAVYRAEADRNAEERESLAAVDSIGKSTDALLAYLASDKSGAEAYNGGYSYGNKRAIVDGEVDGSMAEAFYHYDPVTGEVYLKSVQEITGDSGNVQYASFSTKFMLLPNSASYEVARPLSPQELLDYVQEHGRLTISASVSGNASQPGEEIFAAMGEDGSYFSVDLKNGLGDDVSVVEFAGFSEDVINVMVGK